MDKRRDIILRILELCRSVEEEGLDPFQVDILALFDRLKAILPEIRSREDLMLDAEAVWSLARVIQGQGRWVESRAAMFYFDPLVTLLKIEVLGVDDLADALASAWRPILELEAQSPAQVRRGVLYWMALQGDERKRWEPPEPADSGSIRKEDLAALGFATADQFRTYLRALRGELEERGTGDYWEFIVAPTYDETVRRAYAVAFLTTYGLAGIDADPIEETLALGPATRRTRAQEPSSVPVALNPEEYLRRRGSLKTAGGTRSS